MNSAFTLVDDFLKILLLEDPDTILWRLCIKQRIKEGELNERNNWWAQFFPPFQAELLLTFL